MAKKKPTQQVVRIQKQEGKPLSPSQQAFNKLTARVQKLKELMEKDKNRLENLYRTYMERIPALDETMANRKLEMAAELSLAADRWKFTEHQLSMIRFAIVTLCDSAFQVVEPTAEQQDIYNRWTGGNYEQEVAEEQQDIADFFSDQFKDMFDIDVDFSKFDTKDPESFAKFQAEMADRFAQKQEAYRAHELGGKKTKTKKALEREARERETEKLRQKSVRSIYLSLVKVLHPDRAKDEDDRLEKEERIKQVTKAYQENDLPALLMYESQWMADVSGELADLPEEKLNLYIASLREQAKELESARWIQKRDPKYGPIFDLTRMPEKQALALLVDEAEYKRRMISDMETDLHLLLHKPRKTSVIELATAIASSQQAVDYGFFNDNW